jgi:hypothetical protein
MDKHFTETVAGSYRSMKMPDGTVELFIQVKEDGALRWKMLRDHEKERKEMEEFDKRFEHTETKPSDQVEEDGKPLTKKPVILTAAAYPDPGEFIDSTLGTATRELSSTRRHMYAHLLAVLGGNPTTLLSRGIAKPIIDNLKKNSAHAETVLVIIRSLDLPLWTAVGEKLARELEKA